MSLLALGLLGAASAPATAGADRGPAPLAKVAKKKCKKKAKKKCKKKAAPPAAQAPAQGGGGTSTPPPPPPPDTRTTNQKIDDAVASGAITPEQGLTYKVFAGFNDPRLPAQFVGTPDPLAEAPLDEVTSKWNQLSEGAKAILGPFLIPPMHEGSYWEQLIEGATASATSSQALASPGPAAADPNSPWCGGNAEVVLANWSFVEATAGAAAGKVRIWYQNRFAAADAPLAGTLLSAVETKIWPALTTLMQRDPLPDGGSTESCAGGTDALDVALVDADEATTVPTLGQENTPVHIVFPRAGSRSNPPYLAHEFMHAIEYAFTLASGDLSSGENKWLKESTSQWAQDYVSSPQYGSPLAPVNTEHRALQYFFPFPEESLDDSSKKYHEYGKYVFWLWAARKGNNPNVVPQVWNAIGAQKSLDAAKSVFGGGWAQAWKDFARSNWNQDPVTNYQNWDGITDTPKVESHTTLPSNDVTPVGVSVPPVAAKYLTFVPDAAATTLTYRNLGTISDDAGVQAIITYKDGKSTVQDWTNDTQKDVPFCNIQELTLVLSNASVTPSDNKAFSLLWAPEGSGGPHAAVTPRAADVCIPNPQGTFSGTAHYTDSFTTLDYSWSGNVDFDPDGQTNPWFPDYYTEVWDNASVATGSVTVSGSGTSQGSDGDCSIDIHTTTAQLGPGDGTMTIQHGAEPHYGINLNYAANQLLDATFTCPNMDPFDSPISPPGSLIYTPDPEQTSTRGTYVGTSSQSDTHMSTNYNWNLVDP